MPGLPKVGSVSAWFDPLDPKVWSGVPSAIIRELNALGVYAGHRDATMPIGAGKALYAWMRVTRRSAGWTLRPETRVVSRMSEAVMSRRAPRNVDGWVHFVGGFGPIVGGRYVTLFEMSPLQLLEGCRDWATWLGYAKTTPRQRAWVARRQARAHGRAHACCMASHWAADSLVRDHGIDARRVHVVGYGRNADLPDVPEREWVTPRFLFIGRDWKRKNGAAVVRAFARLRRELPEARLDLVGRHPPVDEEGVTGHGFLSGHEPEGRAEIERLIAESTCLVLPSLFEPFGIVYVEAGNAGLPSIAGNVGGTTDSVGPGGVIVDPHSEDAIYGAMREVAEPDTARALGAAARRHSRALTWSATAARIYQALELGSLPGRPAVDFL